MDRLVVNNEQGGILGCQQLIFHRITNSFTCHEISPFTNWMPRVKGFQNVPERTVFPASIQ